MFADLVVFENTTIGGSAIFEDSVFEAKASFIGSNFIGRAEYRGGTIEEVDFSRAIFDQDVEFQDVEFGDKVLFRSTQFQDDVSVEGSEFHEFDLTDAKIGNQKLSLFDIHYEKLIAHDFNFDWVVRSTDMYSKAYSIDVFSRLEDNFRKQSRATLANEAYLNKRIIECEIARS